jgi:hypothetical protein
LACKLHDIGKSVLKTQGDAEAGTEGPEAVTWLQKAFAVADKLDDSAAHGAPELKVALPRPSFAVLNEYRSPFFEQWVCF